MNELTNDLKSSELILNPDGSIYHLALKPEEIAKTIILVGDPQRVTRVSKHFDRVEVIKEKREFITHTGTYNGQRVSVISTGIGTDNIDIVLNEIDALWNIDLATRKIKSDLTELSFIRIGTSGTLDASIPCDSFVKSENAVGFDGLGLFYEFDHLIHTDFSREFTNKFKHKNLLPLTYYSKAHPTLLKEFSDIKEANTATMPGFYGPQGRTLRMKPFNKNILDHLHDCGIHNFEMETAGIYFLANQMNHKSISLNAIIANRSLGTFSKNPKETVNKLIKHTLETLLGS